VKRKARLIEDKGSDRQDNSGLWSQEFHDLNSSAPYFCYASVPNVPYFDIRIYRESRIKSLIKAQSKDMYRLSTSPTGSENHLSPLRFQTFNRKVF